MSPIPLLIEKVNEFRLAKGDTTSPYLDLEKIITKKPKTVKEIVNRAVKKTMNIKHKMLIQFVYDCNLTINEAIMIKKSDIDLKGGVISVNNRLVPIPTKIVPQIEFYLRYHDLDSYFFNSSRHKLSFEFAKQIVDAAANSGVG